MEFKEDEHVDLIVLEVEVKFKEVEKEEHVIWGCWRSRWSSRRMNMWICLCWKLRGTFNEEEEEEQVLWWCWRSRWSSRRMNMWI